MSLWASIEENYVFFFPLQIGFSGRHSHLGWVPVFTTLCRCWYPSLLDLAALCMDVPSWHPSSPALAIFLPLLPCSFLSPKTWWRYILGIAGSWEMVLSNINKRSEQARVSWMPVQFSFPEWSLVQPLFQCIAQSYTGGFFSSISHSMFSYFPA